MNIIVIGAGYVGLVTAITLAVLGHKVTAVDTDSKKVADLRRGVPPFFEPGLRQALKQQTAQGRLAFTEDLTKIGDGADYAFICVGTPSKETGEADLTYLMDAVQALVGKVTGPLRLVVKSTVPVGTNAFLRDLLTKTPAPSSSSGQTMADAVTVLSNPEFLREGSALQDSLNPDRIVIGATCAQAGQDLAEVYQGLKAPVLLMSPEEAELTKYAANTFLALKISYSNLLADFCEIVGADVRTVTDGIGLDPRIGPHFLKAGMGFGGSCFPKDVRSMVYQAKAKQLDSTLYQEILKINARRVEKAVSTLEHELGGLRDKTIAVLGLAFKPGTDDVRESPAIGVIGALLAAGCSVKAYDPEAAGNAAQVLPELSCTKTPDQAIADADAVVLVTDWPEFAQLPWRGLLKKMRNSVILDGRNMLDGRQLAAMGARYLGMGALDHMPTAD